MNTSIEMREDIAIVEFDDGNKNVVNHAVLDELEAVWEQAESAAGAILFKGREGSFCAGYDIKVMTGADREAANRLGNRGRGIAERIFVSPRPVVGLAQGHAFTIGLVWLAGCDVRFGESGPFQMGMTEVALGVPLRGWSLAALRNRVRTDHQVAALLHSTRYTPEGALEAGFFDHLLPAGEGFKAALAKAGELAKLPADAYRRTKRALRQPVLDLMRADA